MTSYLPMDASVYPCVKWIISERFLFAQYISFWPKRTASQLHSSQISVPKIDLNISEIDLPESFCLSDCFYGRLDGTFLGKAGRIYLPGWDTFHPAFTWEYFYPGPFPKDDFSQDNLESQRNIILAKGNGSSIWYKLSHFSRDLGWANRSPALPGRDEKSPSNLFP